MFVFLIVWIIIQYVIIKVTMTKVPDSYGRFGYVRFEIIVYLFALNAAAFMCGLFLGLINC